MKKLLKLLVWAVLIAGTGFVVYRGVARPTRQGAKSKDRIVPVEVMTARADLPIRETIQQTGEIRAFQRVSVASKVPGRIDVLALLDEKDEPLRVNGSLVPVEEGTGVKKGQGLAVIDHDGLAAQVRQAEAALETARVSARPEVVEAKIAQATAFCDGARADWEKVQAGARPEEREMAKAKVAAWEAGVDRAKADLARANAVLANADSDLDRVRKLYDQKIIPEQQLEEAQMRAKTAREAHGAAREAVHEAEQQLRSAKEGLTLILKGEREEDRRAVAAKLKQAEAALALTKSQTKDLAQAGVAAAEAALDSARVLLRESVVRSPIAGVVTRKHLDQGNQVALGTPIVDVADVATVKVIVGLPERYLSKIEAGKTPVEVRVDAYPKTVFAAAIAKIYPAVDQATRTFQIELRVDNAQGLLRPGMFARATLVTAQKPKAIVVPRDIVLGREGGGVRWLFTVNGAKARRVDVKIGLSEGPDLEILEGLRGGESVIVNGMNYVRDGTAVNVVTRGETR